MSNCLESESCKDSIVKIVWKTGGEVWSPRFGSFQFGRDEVGSADKDSPLVPGSSVHLRVKGEGRGGLKVEELKRRDQFPAETVISGLGTITKVRDGHATLDSDSEPEPLHVPHSAVHNEITGNYQLTELEARKVHFLAMPGSSPRPSSSYSVIALHPWNERCQEENAGKSPTHWLIHQPQNHQLRSYSLLKIPLENEVPLPDTASSKLHGFRINPSGKSVECGDAVVISVKDFSGVVWSPDYGRIQFSFSELEGWSGIDKGTLFPGMTMQVVGRKEGRGMRATRLASLGYMSTMVRESFGEFRSFNDRGGILDSGWKKRILTVPQEAYGWESVEDWEKTRVHFLAITPLRTPGLSLDSEEDGVRVIALHSVRQGCGEDPDSLHWTHHFSPPPSSLHSHPLISKKVPSLSQAPSTSVQSQTVSVPLPDVWRTPLTPFPGSDSTTKVFHDSYFTYIRCSQGYLRSAKFGVVCFDTRCLHGISPRDIIPGTLARKVVAVPFRQDANPSWRNVHNPKWKAVSVEVGEERRRSTEIYSGTGIVTEEKHTFGFLKNLRNGEKMFVPGWAGVNNLGAGSIGWQIAQLAEGEVHFLAMPNPKPKHEGEPFVIAAHPFSELCSQPAGATESHWIYPLAPQSPTPPSLSQRMKLKKVLGTLSDDRISLFTSKCPLTFQWLFSNETSISSEIQEEIHLLKSLGIIPG